MTIPLLFSSLPQDVMDGSALIQTISNSGYIKLLLERPWNNGVDVVFCALRGIWFR